MYPKEGRVSIWRRPVRLHLLLRQLMAAYGSCVCHRGPQVHMADPTAACLAGAPAVALFSLYVLLAPALVTPAWSHVPAVPCQMQLTRHTHVTPYIKGALALP